MNNYISLDDLSSQVFFTYKPEKNAIYVVPNISANYGYILPISNRSLTGNTYTFIYHRKHSCEMFIAPISQRKQFSKTFVSYRKYVKKMKNHLNRRRTMSYTNIIEIPKSKPIKKSNTYSDFSYSYDLTPSAPYGSPDRFSKMMEIFDMSINDLEFVQENTQEKWSLCANDFTAPQPICNYVFSSSPDKYVEDFVFDD